MSVCKLLLLCCCYAGTVSISHYALSRFLSIYLMLVYIFIHHYHNDVMMCSLMLMSSFCMLVRRYVLYSLLLRIIIMTIMTIVMLSMQ